MDGSKSFFRLTVGLCLMICYVNAVPLSLFGFGPNEEDMVAKLEQYKQEKLQLETQLANTNNQDGKNEISKELQKVNDAIANIESSHKIVYKEHLEKIDELTEKFEKENADLRLKKEIIEYAHEKHSLEALLESNKKSLEQIAHFEERLQKLEENLKMISDPIAAYAELIHQQQEDMKQEKEGLKQEGEEIAKKIQEAQDRALNSKNSTQSS